MKFFTYIFIFFCVHFVHSQELDSLMQRSYENLKNQYKNLEYTNPKSAKIYAEALLVKAKKEGNTLEEHVAFLLKASSENYFGDMSTSLKYIDTTISYSKAQKNDSLLIKALSQKGKTYFTYGKYTNAITYYLQLDSLAKATKNIRYQIYSNHSIGSIKNLLGDHIGATKLFLKNKDIITPLIHEKKYETVYLNTLIGLCSAYTYYDLDAASDYLPKLKKFSMKANDTDALSYYFTLRGIVAYKRKKYAITLAVLDQADSLITVLGTKRNLFPVYRFRGKVYFDTKQYSDAIVAFEAIKSLQSDVKFDHFEFREILSLLAISYEQLKNNEKAIQNYRLAYNLSNIDTLQETIRYTILKKYDKKTLEDKIVSLKVKSDQKDKQNTSLLVICNGLIAMLAMLFFIYKKQQRHNKRKFDKLLKRLASGKAEVSIQESTNKYQISDEKISKILVGLEKFEKEKLFLHQNTTLIFVAKKLNTNTSYLSEIVNTHEGVTFKNYITQLRINYVLTTLKNDKVLRSYSIKAIAKEIGFKSEGAFSRAFKKQTGIYPSFFIKNLAAIS
jgi:AraC-like DNA-binding protein